MQIQKVRNQSVMAVCCPPSHLEITKQNTNLNMCAPSVFPKPTRH
jgi:hypothetical protein